VSWHGRWQKLTLAIPALFSIALKVRWLPHGLDVVDPLRAPMDQTILAAFEWSDVFLILLWTASFVWSERPKYAMVLQVSSQEVGGQGNGDGSPVLFVSARRMTQASLVLYLGARCR